MQSHRRQGLSSLSSIYIPKESFLEHLLQCNNNNNNQEKKNEMYRHWEKKKKKTGQPVPAAPVGVKGVVIGLSLMIIIFDDSRLTSPCFNQKFKQVEGQQQ